MADTPKENRGEDFGTGLGALPGHTDPSIKPIVNAELTQANPKQITVIPHPGVRTPHN